MPPPGSPALAVGGTPSPDASVSYAVSALGRGRTAQDRTEERVWNDTASAFTTLPVTRLRMNASRLEDIGRRFSRGGSVGGRLPGRARDVWAGPWW